MRVLNSNAFVTLALLTRYKETESYEAVEAIIGSHVPRIQQFLSEWHAGCS